MEQKQKNQKERGQVLIITVLFTMIITGTIIAGVTTPLVRQLKAASDFRISRSSYFLAETLTEDIIYRFKNGHAVSADELLTLNGETATAIVTDAGSNKQIVSTGNVSNLSRTVKTSLSTNTVGVSFYYGVQVGEGGLSMENNSTVNGNVYSNGNIVGASGAVITGDAIVAGGISANPEIEWTINTTNNNFATSSTNEDIAQSFSTGASSGSLSKVSLYLAKVGNPTNNISVRITGDNSGKPDTSSLAVGTISYTSVGTSASWIDVTFASPANLSSGTKYWIVLDTNSNSTTNYWNWRKDPSDGYTSNTGRYTSNYSTGSATWTNVGGDLAFRAWIGGTTNRIEAITIGNASTGTARANLFVNTSVHGSACPNIYCIVDNPPVEALPISDGVINDWKNAASLGGTISGNYSLPLNQTTTMGPKKITGNMTIGNNATLTLTGTVYVEGDITTSSGAKIKLSSGYGANSGILIADGIIDAGNGTILEGSGTAGSYIMLVSDKDDITGTVISVSNNSAGVVYYANRGRINFSNNATAKEATAYGINLSQNSSITYETGLASAVFSSGPAGSFSVVEWRETE